LRKLGMIRQMTGLFVRHCLVRKDLKSRSGTATDKLIWFTHGKRVPGRMTWQKKAGAPGCGVQPSSVVWVSRRSRRDESVKVANRWLV